MNRKVSKLGNIRIGRALVKQMVYRCVPSGCVVQSVDIREGVVYVEIEWMGRREEFPLSCIKGMWKDIGGEEIAKLELMIITPYRDFLLRWWYTLGHKGQGMLFAVMVGLLWSIFGFWKMLFIIAMGVGGCVLGNIAESVGGWRELFKKLYPFR